MKCRNCHLREMTIFYGEASLSTGNEISLEWIPSIGSILTGRGGLIFLITN